MLTLGLDLIIIGAIIDILDEWKDRGLTDTSYRALFPLALGTGLAAGSAWDGTANIHILARSIPALGFVTMIAMKLMDLVRTRFRL